MRKILLAITVITLVFAACKKEDVLSQSRLFRPVIKAPLASEANYIDVSWQKIAGAKNYTVQISKDTFRTIAGTATVDTNYYRFQNLEWNKTYQVQVKANAADTTYNSKYSFLGSIKTPVFPTILNTPGVSDVTDNAVKVSWATSGAAVSSIKILKTSDSSVISTTNLSAADVSNGYKIISGLSASTGYTIFLYSGTTVRGWADFTTKAPYVGNVVDLRGFTGRPTLLADTIPVVPSGSIILLKRGETYNISAAVSLNKSLVFTSGSDLTATSQARIFFTSNFNFTAGAVIDSIEFNDVYMYSDNYTSRYVFNTTGGATVGKMKFMNVRAEIFRGLVRLQSGTTTVNNFIVNNSILDSLQGYGVITVDNVTCKADNISITNSTIYKAEKIITSRQNSTSVLIENVTINESPLGNGSNYIVDYNTSGTNNVTNGITVNNSILGIGKVSAGLVNVRDIRANAATTINANNNYKTADRTSLGNELPGIIPYSRTSVQLWQDPYNGNFKIIDNLFPGRSNTGDPRWRL